MNEQQMLGELIKKARTEQKLSQGQLAKILEVQNPIIYKYEKGLIKTIPFEKRVKLSEALKVPITNLLYENEKNVGINAVANKTWDVFFKFADAIMCQSKEEALTFLLEQVKGKTLATAISDTALATYIAESADEQYKGIMMQGLQGLLIDRGINQENAAQLAAILQELLSFKFAHDLTFSEKIAAGQKESK